MRYKTLGCLACACAIALSIAAPAFERGGGSPRYHQHRDAPAKTSERLDGGFSTHLPLQKTFKNVIIYC